MSRGGAGEQASVARGLGYARLGQWQQAIRALTTALEESPEHVEAHHQLAVCHAQTGNAREARRLLQRALGLPRLGDAERVGLLRVLGRVGIQMNDYALAAECFEEALGITGTSGGPILNQLAQVMCKSGDYERGFALYVRAMKGGGPR